MGIILNGIGVGFFVAVFLTVYLNGFFQQQVPIVLIYGIFGPLSAAIIISVLILYDKKERKKAEVPFWSMKKEDDKYARRD